MIIAHNNDYKTFNELLLKSVCCLQKYAECLYDVAITHSPRLKKILLIYGKNNV